MNTFTKTKVAVVLAAVAAVGATTITQAEAAKAKHPAKKAAVHKAAATVNATADAERARLYVLYLKKGVKPVLAELKKPSKNAAVNAEHKALWNAYAKGGSKALVNALKPKAHVAPTPMPTVAPTPAPSATPAPTPAPSETPVPMISATPAPTPTPSAAAPQGTTLRLLAGYWNASNQTVPFQTGNLTANAPTYLSNLELSLAFLGHWMDQYALGADYEVSTNGYNPLTNSSSGTFNTANARYDGYLTAWGWTLGYRSDALVGFQTSYAYLGYKADWPLGLDWLRLGLNLREGFGVGTTAPAAVVALANGAGAFTDDALSLGLQWQPLSIDLGYRYYNTGGLNSVFMGQPGLVAGQHGPYADLRLAF